MSLPETRTLRVEVGAGFAWVEFARPERRNALSLRMARELAAVLDELAVDEAVRALGLRGAGGHFCSGGDLAPEGEADAMPEARGRNTTHAIMSDVYGPAIAKLVRFPKPVVACVRGVAAGAGANLAFACDLVYAAREARFCEIFVRRGLSLDCAGSWLLPRLVGLQRAKELAFFGDWLAADRAAEIGLVTEVFEDDALDDAVAQRLERLAAGPPLALRHIKRGLERAQGSTLEQALEWEAMAQADCTGSEDVAEGLRAFLEKRAPVFRGR